MSGEYHRAARGVDQLGGAANHQPVSARRGAVAGQIHFFGPIHLDLFREYVLGDVHENGAGAPGVGNVERLFDCAGDFGCVHHQVVVLGDGQGDAGDVGLLEGVRPDGGAPDLAGYDDHRDGIHLRGGDAGDEVGGARTGRRPGDAGASGDSGVAVGGVRRALLVANQYMAQLRVLRQYLVQGQYRPAGETENDVHAFPYQGFADYLSSVASHVLSNLRRARGNRRVRRPRADCFFVVRSRKINQSKNPAHQGTGSAVAPIPRGTTQVVQSAASDLSSAR